MLRTTALLAALVAAHVPNGSARADDAPAVPRGYLVIVGGGTTGQDIRHKTLALAGGPDARVVVVPQASADPEAGRGMAEQWRLTGARDIEILDLADPKAAMDVIARADLIWMRGGSQVRLMDALEAGGVSEAIRRRYHEGATVGGTSAGAAVMSALMIAGYAGRRGTPEGLRPRLSPGLALWPEAIVDQHFIRRDRFARLRAAVREHPEMLGVGIDESTAVVVHGPEFEVIGASDVVVMDARPAVAERDKMKVINAGNKAEADKDKDDDAPAEGGGGGAEDAPPGELELAEVRLKAGMHYHLDKGVVPMRAAAAEAAPVR